MKASIPKDLSLYRYDIKEPPNSWDSDNHSNSTEYSNFEDHGKKNKEGFYFLFDDRETTELTAQKACEKQKQEKYWLTTTSLKKKISIIDFSECKCLHDLLTVLDTLQIDVYNSQLKIYDYEEEWSISDLKDHHRATTIRPKKPSNPLFELHIPRFLTELDELEEVGYFGQLLTDFDNGKVFKKLIKNSGLEIDGYRWCESNKPSGLTYCLFEVSKLDEPNKTEKKIGLI